MRGRWAAGIEPRNFAWILKDQLAVSERPGGFAPHHRRVRRQEEILWLGANGFTRVVSLLPSNHNLHAYDELHLPASHFAIPAHGDARPVLAELYSALWAWLHAGERVLVHQDELGEQVAGVVAGFLCWSGILSEPPRAVSAVEQLLRRQMGHAGRSIVALAAELPTGPAARERLQADGRPEPPAAGADRAGGSDRDGPAPQTSPDPEEPASSGPAPTAPPVGLADPPAPGTAAAGMDGGGGGAAVVAAVPGEGGRTASGSPPGHGQAAGRPSGKAPAARSRKTAQQETVHQEQAQKETAKKAPAKKGGPAKAAPAEKAPAAKAPATKAQPTKAAAGKVPARRAGGQAVGGAGGEGAKEKGSVPEEAARPAEARRAAKRAAPAEPRQGSAAPDRRHRPS